MKLSAALTSMLFLLLMPGGCVRRTTTSQDFGLAGAVTQTPQKKASRPVNPDEALRAVFRQQTRGAFNLFADDPQARQLEERLKANPQDISGRLELALIYENYGLAGDAFEQYREALQTMRVPGASAPNRAAEQAASGLGRSGRRAMRGAEAIALLEEVLQEMPSANLWNELGVLYGEANDLKRAEAALREAVARDTASAPLRNNLGYNLLLQNRLEAAEAEFRRALELSPNAATVRNNLGAALARRGDLREALEQFRLVADAATAHNNLAVVLLEMGQYEQSREQLVKALSLRRNFAPALANFKLVQVRIRERAGTPAEAGRDSSPVAQSKNR
jgi:Tfp pilus assembly protein PilF